MSTRLVACALSACCLVGLTLPAPAQEKKPQPPAGAKPEPPQPGQPPKPPEGLSPEMQEAFEAGMRAMQPGPAHQKLAALAGAWTYKSKMSMPGQSAEESEGTAKLSMILDGRFLHEENAGTMMGMPFQGGKLLGYNNGSKKYEGVWMYTLGTGMLLLSGTSDDDGKTVRCTASFDNEVGIRETMNVTYKFTDNDHFSVLLEGGKMPDGSPGPVMEATYTRVK